MAKKLFYKIGEACKKVDVQPYVLRYWETEFDLLSPDKSKSGQRVYTEGDLAIIRRIKELLYEEGYTTVGAKKKLQAELAVGRSGDEESGGETESSAAAKPGTSDAKPDTKPDAKSKVEPEPASSGGDPETSVAGRVSKSEEGLRDGIRAALMQTREILHRLS